MTPNEKQLALKRLREILLATIDYLIKRQQEHIKFDDVAAADTSYYQNMKQVSEKCYQNKRVSSLQKILDQLIAIPLTTGDTRFNGYIKEKTGFDINIFQNLQEGINKIFQQKRIKTENECRDAIAMMSLYKQTSAGQEKIDLLNKLCNDFRDRISKRKVAGNAGVSCTSHDLTALSEINSPDNKRRAAIVENDIDIDNPVTQVIIFFEKANGTVYAAKGINQDIKTFWKDNNTVIIETKKDYVAITKWKQVQSFNDMVKVEYVES